MDGKRLEIHRRDEKLEDILKEVNNLLYPIEEMLISSYKKYQYPIILIMGAARSGTTLLLQWLAESGYFAYPTNMLSRFYEAPYIGAKIQLMLIKYDYNNEISKSFSDQVSYNSSLGKTKGALAPHEFWYFWRRFFKFREIHKLEDDDLENIDIKRFIAELAALEDVFNKPLVMKGMIVNWHIPFMDKILDKVLFIHVKREPLYQIQSLIQAREKYYGDRNIWYSFKPPEYTFLKDMNPYEQIAGQIYYTNKAIEEGFQKINQKKFLTVQYEDFCNSPVRVYDEIKNKFAKQGIELNKYNGPNYFTSTNKIKLKENEIEKIIDGYQKITGNKIKI